ncbi:ACN9-domain-containing protein [Neoconidiobolus thromboides FSU 785]|nr:ACN9-domain-containing protein [Neoconidiobolus thromboides FSU 785]
MNNLLQGRQLYRKILRLHRNLSPHQRIIGDSYVKEEFHKHKNLTLESPFLNAFTKEWNIYLDQLEEEFKNVPKKTVGSSGIKPKTQDLERFSPEQIDTLYELYEETQKPKLPN